MRYTPILESASYEEAAFACWLMSHQYTIRVLRGSIAPGNFDEPHPVGGVWDPRIPIHEDEVSTAELAEYAEKNFPVLLRGAQPSAYYTDLYERSVEPCELRAVYAALTCLPQ